MFKVTPGFSTSLPPNTIDAWRGRLDRFFAQQSSRCEVAKGIYPIPLPPLSRYVQPLAVRGVGQRVTNYLGSWASRVTDYTGPLGTVTVHVDAHDLEVHLRHHRRTDERDTPAEGNAPAMTLAFSEPVRIAVNLLPDFAETRGANWVCGAYYIAAISRIVLDGRGRLTLHAETGPLLAWPLHRAEKLLKLCGYDPAALDLDTRFFEDMVDALMTVPAQAGSAPGPEGGLPPAPLGGLAVSTGLEGLDRYWVKARGNLSQVAKEHPLARAILKNPLCQALLPPMKAAVRDPQHRDVAYRLRTQANYDAGTLRMRARAMPANPCVPAWDVFATLADVNQPARRRITQILALALDLPSLQVFAAGYPRRLPPADAAPLVALVHGFDDIAALRDHDAPPQLPAPPPAPVVPAPPLSVPLPGLPSALPKAVEEPLVRMLGHVRIGAQTRVQAGTYSTDAWAPNSRLVVPVDGRFELEVETQPINDAQEVRLQRAALRWTGNKPLVWHFGFSNFLLTSAVGRLLDCLFQVRIRGVKADAAGRLEVDGDLYLLGLRICRVDTLAQWAASKWPDTCPMMFAETNAAQWLEGIFLRPDVPVTNDECWHMWRNIRAMDLSFQWQLQPLGDATQIHLGADGIGKFSTAPLAGEVHLTDAGDAHVSIASAPQQTSCFDFAFRGALHLDGAWSADITKHMFPYPEHTLVDATTVDETRVSGVVDMQLRAPKPAQIHAEINWAAAKPTAVQLGLQGGVTLDGGYVAGKIDALGHAPSDSDTGFMLDRATWTLDHDLPMPSVTLQAGAGGFFTALTDAQRAFLMRLRGAQQMALPPRRAA